MKIVIVLAFLLVFALSLSISRSHQWYASKHLTLSFDYAARQGQPFSTNLLNVIWNGETVQQITPSDYDLHHVTLKLKAKEGLNTISFAGEGTSDGLGATIDNVKLVRPNSCSQGDEDLIQNGGFEKGHSVGTGWNIFKGQLEGWKGEQIEVGHGKIYNSNWEEGTHVCQLDGNHNDVVSQSFQFDEYFRISKESPKPEFTLKFQYADRLGVPFYSQGLSVYWNQEKLETINPSDYNVHTFTHSVVPKVGSNNLKFVGEGHSDGLGTTFTHVQLIGKNGNLIQNGNFDSPDVGGGWRIFTSIPGWTGDEIEVGHGHIYNGNWPANSHIVEIDGNHNDHVSQEIKLDDSYNKV